MKNISILILLNLALMVCLSCATQKGSIKSDSCVDKKVDSLFQFHFKEFENILVDRKEFYSISEEGKLLSYILSLVGNEGNISIDYAGYIAYDSFTLGKWEDWYDDNQCNISWMDIQYGFDLLTNMPSDIDLDKEIEMLDSLLSN